MLIVFLLWITFIFYNSSQTGHSSNHVSYQITKVVAAGIEKIGLEPITHQGYLQLNKIIRKIAHGFQFCVFAILLRILLENLKVKKENIVFYTLLIALFFAAGDEFHQLFVSGRTPKITDVLIDFSGAIIGVILYKYIKNTLNKKITCQKG